MGCSASVEAQTPGSKLDYPSAPHNGVTKTVQVDKAETIPSTQRLQEKLKDEVSGDDESGTSRKALEPSGKVKNTEDTKKKDDPEPMRITPMHQAGMEENKVPEPLTEEQVAVEKALQDLRLSLFGNNGAITPAKTVSSEEEFTNMNMRGMSPGLDNETISQDVQCKVAVIDAGTGFCKAGMMGEEIPSVVIPTIVGRQKEEGSDEVFIGKDAKLRGGMLRYSRPIHRGVVADWDDMEKVYDHLLHMDLNLEPNEYGVAIPEPPNSTRDRREKLAEMMFEKFNARKLYLGSSPSLAMHAFGMCSGLVVSIGHSVCNSVPVLQGNAMNDACRSTNIGNEDLIRRMQTLMEAKHKLKLDEDIARAMIEKTCFATSKCNGGKTSTKTTYTLPNGDSLELHDERFSCAEIFFNPKEVLGSDEKSIVDICRESLQAVTGTKTASELRRNIILIGGPSLLPGLNERLKFEVSKDQPPSDEANVLALPKRQYAAWRGASMLASLNSSKHRWLTKAQFDDHGASIIHRKYL